MVVSVRLSFCQFTMGAAHQVTRWTLVDNGLPSSCLVPTAPQGLWIVRFGFWLPCRVFPGFGLLCLIYRHR